MTPWRGILIGTYQGPVRTSCGPGLSMFSTSVILLQTQQSYSFSRDPGTSA